MWYREWMKISVVMPIYNEVGTLSSPGSPPPPFEKEVIIVDDGSRDGTRERLEKLDPSSGIKIFYHERNLGKSAALRTGFRHVTGEIVLIQDADLEYNPVDYAKLLKLILDGKTDVVYGSRFMRGRGTAYGWHFAVNRLLTFLGNMLTRLDLSDIETCYKAFRREVLDQIRSQRFGFDPEFTVKAAKRKLRICEVQIEYLARGYHQGKKASWLDGLESMFSIFWFRLFN